MTSASKKKRSTQDAREFISIRGARMHNLRNVSVRIPKNKLVVITGLSGSGKSSLAFDTLYAEAERRYVESLSSYARQFLGIKEKPDVDAIEGLSPAISIDQKSVSKNPRSTVGTITEIYDYLRILFARAGTPHCPECGRAVGRQTADQIVDAIKSMARGRELFILAPVVRGKKGEYKTLLGEIKRAGFARGRIDSAVMTLEEALRSEIDKKRAHDIDVVVDRFAPGPDIERSRIRDSVETALKMGKGMMSVAPSSAAQARESVTRDRPAERRRDVGGEEAIFSEHFSCVSCGVNLPDIEPRTFSFNSPYGACRFCTGLGSTLKVDPERVIPNKRLSIAEGAIRPWAAASHRLGRQSWYWWILTDLAERHGFSLNDPVEKLSKAVLNIILFGERGESKEFRVESKERREEEDDDQYGINGEEERKDGAFEGVIANLKRRWKETDSDFTRAEIEKYMKIEQCPECGGRRLRREALAVKIGPYDIAAITNMSAADAKALFAKSAVFGLDRNRLIIAQPLIREIVKRLQFLCDVGLEYLALARESTTLSGGEAQRIQLATQIGSRLTGIMYILDEPSIGLHPRDHSRLIATLKDLRDLGNTVIVVEHDAETMRSADWIVELGPGAGKHGGRVVFEGATKALLKSMTLTGEYLSGRKKVAIRGSKVWSMKYEVCGKNASIASKSSTKSGVGRKYLEIKGAAEHNLKKIDVKIPLEKFVCISGVSGSGKSTLVNDILAKALLRQFHRAETIPGKYSAIEGTAQLDKVIVVDQSPIGRTPRSNPATYTGAFGFIRMMLAGTHDAKVRGYAPGRFSFNVKGGRCEACEGQGVKKIEMHFLPDVYIECEECGGKRYNREALEIEYNGKNIAAILGLTIDDALAFFDDIPQIRAKLSTLADVGLGYMQLGQPAPTLSGGEAQRVKLATELARRDTGRTLYILDEPTTGLHFDDIQKLLTVLHALVERGNTVLVIEHNLDVIRNADWIIDLGPEGGENGGCIVAEGTPSDIARVKKSYTGQWLKR
ncbi:MAG: excinuclease ABC subunit UvrA [Patescibacteria group bacterium]